MTHTDINGWFDFEDLYRRLAQQATPESVLLEVGVWRGRSIAFLAQTLQQLGKRPRLLAAIDTWRGSPGEEHMQESIRGLGGADALYLEFLDNMIGCGVRSLVRPLRLASLEAAKLFQPGTVDVCFIDADHSYEAVRSDLDAWLPAVRPGGLLAGHDVDLEGVDRAVREQFNDDFTVEGRCWLHRVPLTS